MNRIGLRLALVNVLSADVKVWADFIPEGKDIPAVAYSHITGGDVRILKGVKTNHWDTWRVTVTGNSKGRTDVDDIVATIKTLDNTSDVNFTNIFVIGSGDVPSAPDDEYRTSFVDIKTYG